MMYVALYLEDLTEAAKARVIEKLGLIDADPYLPIAYIERDVRKGQWDIPDAGNLHALEK